jgi:hypothetical protein
MGRRTVSTTERGEAQSGQDYHSTQKEQTLYGRECGKLSLPSFSPLFSSLLSFFFFFAKTQLQFETLRDNFALST